MTAFAPTTRRSAWLVAAATALAFAGLLFAVLPPVPVARPPTAVNAEPDAPREETPANAPTDEAFVLAFARHDAVAQAHVTPPAPAPPPAPPPPPQPPRLVAIVAHAGSFAALLFSPANDSLAESVVGSRVDDWTVLALSRDAITLRHVDGTRAELSLSSIPQAQTSEGPSPGAHAPKAQAPQPQVPERPL